MLPCASSSVSPFWAVAALPRNGVLSLLDLCTECFAVPFLSASAVFKGIKKFNDNYTIVVLTIVVCLVKLTFIDIHS